MGASVRADKAHGFFLELQDRISEALSIVDGKAQVRTDAWEREGGGGGRSRVLLDGEVLEKGGVNVSLVHGELPDGLSKELPGEGARFVATGISLVLHPRSPLVPTVHMNYRYLERGDARGFTGWFGGGTDLTPWILYEEDACHFHAVLAEVCARHPGVASYPEMKRACDEYFYLPHRDERRGIGGIFFDYLGAPPPKGRPAALADVERFVHDAGPAFLDAYLPIVERRRHLAFTEEERQWQLLRRGRYVEFNLVYDRGTIFGLRTKGRVESILMSLPNLVRWGYAEEPRPGSYQERLVEVLRAPRDWLAESR